MIDVYVIYNYFYVKKHSISKDFKYEKLFYV